MVKVLLRGGIILRATILALVLGSVDLEIDNRKIELVVDPHGLVRVSIGLLSDISFINHPVDIQTIFVRSMEWFLPIYDAEGAVLLLMFL